MKILNPWLSDYHIHSHNYSDWISTIEEIVKFAWEIWMTEIAITDHSSAMRKRYETKLNVYCSWVRSIVTRWQNPHNDVNVIFWVEWDILNEDWDFCYDIQWIPGSFVILSAHSRTYTWNPEKITEATIKAIEKHHDIIKFIAHPCNNNDFWKYYDIEKLVEVANKYNIPLEFNAKNLYNNRTNLEKLDYLLKNANEIYINSDAHTLWELKEVRKIAFKYLEENGYI